MPKETEPTKRSLREIPEVDFRSDPRAVRNEPPHGPQVPWPKSDLAPNFSPTEMSEVRFLISAIDELARVGV
jgi:hypothetical protein